MAGFKGALFGASASGPTTPPVSPYTVEYLLIAGGGGGGGSGGTSNAGGGGGAGGYVCGSNSMTPGDTATVSIGAGGTCGWYCRQLPIFPGQSGWSAGCQGGCTTMTSPNPNYNNVVAHSGGGGGTHNFQLPLNTVYDAYTFYGASGPAPQNPRMCPYPVPGPAPAFRCGPGQGRPGGSGGGASGREGLYPCGSWGAPSCVPGQGNRGGDVQSWPSAAYKGGGGGGGAGSSGGDNWCDTPTTCGPPNRQCCSVGFGGSGGTGITWGPATYAGGGSGGSNYYDPTPAPLTNSCVDCIPGPGGGGGNGGYSGRFSPAAACAVLSASICGSNGTTNTGGGGGGGGAAQYPAINPVLPGPYARGGAGGSGLALFRYLGPPKGSGGTIFTPGDGYTYHCFTGAGTFTA